MRRTCVALLVLVSSVASAGNALDKPAFTATPAELLAAAKAAPAHDGGVMVLRHDETITFDDHGLATVRARWVFVIQNEDAVQNWGTLRRAWRPWNENRPAMRARVISGSGTVSEVDSSKLVDQAAATGERRELTTPLPNLQPGCVVEEEFTSSDSAPTLGGRSLLVEMTADGQVTLSAPASLKAHVVERALPAKLAAHHGVSGGRETWTYTFTNHVPADRESNEPDDVYTWPLIAITAAPSWTTVAKAYAGALEPHLALALPAGLTPGMTRENAAAITAWMHAHVQFTGVDLTNAPVDGIDLAAVLKRGSGDANEVGALLAALLRAAGFAPELVLGHRGWQAGFDRDRPALSSFDHVLIRVPLATGDLWIDPEDRDAIVGQLDAFDQGTLALAITRGALVTVPAAPATANMIREVRTFTLAPIGPASVHEVTVQGGAFESSQRGWDRKHGLAEQRKSLVKYVSDVYDGTLETFATTSPEDLTKPLELTLDIRNTGRADTQWSKAGVYLTPSATFGQLPSELKSTDADPRRNDLVIHVPHVYEIENRIIVPDGFTLPAPVAERTRAVGPLRFVERQRVDGRTLIVTYRMEATATRLTPKQVADARDALAAIRGEDVHFVFENTGWSLIHKGKFREGLAELDRVIAAAPSPAIEHARLAQALILIGDGDGARREARKAVEIDPKSTHTYAALGWVLTHDLAGRQWAPGHDHAGARAALEQARKLDPHHEGAAAELARVLERGTRGHKYDAGSDLLAAAEAWRAANAIEQTDEHELGVVRALLYGGNAAEAVKEARGLEPSNSRDVLLVAAIAIAEGPDAAIVAAPPTNRQRVLYDAAMALMTARHYDLMRRLVAESGADRNSWAPIFQSLQRFDTPFRPGKDPRDVGLALVLDSATHAKPSFQFWDAKVADDIVGTEWRVSVPDGMTGAILVDMARSAATVHVDGDANAWRIEVELQGHKSIVYAALDHGVPKVIGAPYAVRGVGAHVLRLSGKHDGAATRLLDWIAQDANYKRDLGKLWGGSQPRDLPARTLVASWLLDEPARNVSVGTACGATTEDAQLVCGHMVWRGDAALHKWDDLLAFATAWASRSTAADPLAAQIAALIHLGRIDDAEHALDAALAKHPDDLDLLELRAEAGAGHVSTKELVDRLDAIARSRPTDGNELNQVAWMKLTWGVDLPGALYDAKMSVDFAKTSRAAANTLAAIKAENGDLREAVTEVQHAVELAHLDEPAGADWYVLGRIYELAGLRDDAIAAYRRLPKHDTTTLIVNTELLAARRLDALGVKR